MGVPRVEKIRDLTDKLDKMLFYIKLGVSEANWEEHEELKEILKELRLEHYYLVKEHEQLIEENKI